MKTIVLPMPEYHDKTCSCSKYIVIDVVNINDYVIDELITIECQANPKEFTLFQVYALRKYQGVYKVHLEKMSNL